MPMHVAAGEMQRISYPGNSARRLLHELSATPLPAPRFSLYNYLVCLKGVLVREGLRFLNHANASARRYKGAAASMWLFIFAAGFRQVLGVTDQLPPYNDPCALRRDYIHAGPPSRHDPARHFRDAQSSLSMVYDREMGNMRTLLVSLFPRWFLLVSKLLAGVVVLAQVYVFSSWSPGSGT